jgi:hypothetical protein
MCAFLGQLENFPLRPQGVAMSQLDMRPAVDAPNGRQFLVVAIDCADYQKYLGSENDVLTALYGTAPMRVDVRSRNLGQRYLYPDSELAEWGLLQDYPDTTLTELRAQMSQDGWATRALRKRLVSAVRAELPQPVCASEIWRMDVRLVLIGEPLLSLGSVLPKLLCGDFNPFPNATSFRQEDMRGSQPVMLKPDEIISWYKPPLCDSDGNCHPRLMKAAGSGFICESCGSTKFI